MKVSQSCPTLCEPRDYIVRGIPQAGILECWRRNETPTLQSGLNLYIFNTCFLQLLYFISFAQQSKEQVAKHYDLVTIQCAGAGRDNFYLNLFTAAKTLFWGTSLST